MSERDPELTRRVEEASLNAWPAMHQLLLDRWLLRMSNGFTKRANCVVPLYEGGSDDGTEGDELVLLDKIRYCENLYAREQLQTIFRLTNSQPHDHLDRVLAERGYRALDTTLVQLAELRRPLAQEGEIELLPLPEWLQIYSRLARMPATASELHATLIRAIRPDCAFGIVRVDGAPVACLLGVLEHDLLGLFDVITHPDHRGAGHAGRLISGILNWGREQGARRAYLQVVADNEPAISLYARLGFRELYRYWYRQTG
ncbi:MAG: GNAT family N-acetyltransferase [Pseudomonadota bacterium]